MLLKSLNGVCCALIHAGALGCAAAGLYFFLGSSVELVLVALIMLGAAIALEVIAELVSDDTMAPT
jgi:hypothetical protein